MKITKVFSIVLSLHVGVILLVMFQPSCQTAGVRNGSTKPDSNLTASPDQSFNQALASEEKPAPLRKPGGIPVDEFAAPSRPAPGELIVPERNNASIDPVPAIKIPGNEIPAPMDLKPKDLAVYKIQKGDTLWGIARKNGISLSSLLQANPNMDKNGRLSIGQEVMIPAGNGLVTSPSAVSVDPVPSTHQTTGDSYIIQTGDTLSRIARKHGIKLSVLLQSNGLSLSSVIRPGQVLAIPSQGEFVATPRQNVSSPVVPSGATTHSVQKGENLSRIASIYGVTVAQIMQWNGLSNPGLIRTGQSLIVSQANSTEGIIVPEAVPSAEVIPEDDSGSLQDFFNDSPTIERPIIDVSNQP